MRAALLVGLLWLVPASALAHPEHLGQALYVDVRASGLSLEITLSPGAGVSDAMIRLLDPDGDGVSSASEAAQVADTIARSLEVRVDGAPYPVTGASLEAPSMALLATGQATLRFRAEVALALEGGLHAYDVMNRYAPTESTCSLHAFAVRSETRLMAQRRGAEGRALHLEVEVTPPVVARRAGIASFGGALDASLAGSAVALLLIAPALAWRHRRRRVPSSAA